MCILEPGYILHGKAYAYEIERPLGQGSFGITYLARIRLAGTLGSLDSSVRVAVKEFFMREINGREGATVTCSNRNGLYDKYRTKFVREAENLGRLNHPHIVRVLEAFEANNTAYYAMEYIDGGTLNDHIAAHNGLPEEEGIVWMQQIGSALAYMHDHRMLHLDLKPGNIMRRSDGTGVLIDFGLSKQYDTQGEPESSTSVGAGTPGYAPIEQQQYREGREFPVTMDVYALGATLYKMLTGQRPPLAWEILNEGFPTKELEARGVRPGLIACIRRAMEPRKDHRYACIADFLAAVGRLEPLSEPVVLRVEPEPDTQPGGLANPWPPSREARQGSDEPEAADDFDEALEVTLLEPGTRVPDEAATRFTQPAEPAKKAAAKPQGFWAAFRADWRERSIVTSCGLLLLFAASLLFNIGMFVECFDAFNEPNRDIRSALIGGFMLCTVVGFYLLLRNRLPGFVCVCASLLLLPCLDCLCGGYGVDILGMYLLFASLIIALLSGSFFLRRNKRSMWRLLRERSRRPALQAAQKLRKNEQKK